VTKLGLLGWADLLTERQADRLTALFEVFTSRPTTVVPSSAREYARRAVANVAIRSPAGSSHRLRLSVPSVQFDINHDRKR
jgi:hypothetical protein